MLEIDLKKAVLEIKKKNAKIVALQLPEGLKPNATLIAEEIESKTDATTLTFVEPCFGACGLADEKAKALGCELVVHFSHSQFFKTAFPTIYVPVKYKLSKKVLDCVFKKIESSLKKFRIKKVSLVASAPFVNYLEELKHFLKNNNFQVLVGKGNISLKGQILGCNYSSIKKIEKKVNAIVFFGDGLFHPLGIAFVSKKKVLIANPLSKEVKFLDKEREKFLRKRFGLITMAKDGKNFGILVSTMKGQQNLKKALKIKQELEAHGKNAFVLVSEFILPEHFLGSNIDVLVNTACPRIALDDSESFKQPILNPSELEILLGKRKISNYKVEELK